MKEGWEVDKGGPGGKNCDREERGVLRTASERRRVVGLVERGEPGGAVSRQLMAGILWTLKVVTVATVIVDTWLTSPRVKALTRFRISCKAHNLTYMRWKRVIPNMIILHSALVRWRETERRRK